MNDPQNGKMCKNWTPNEFFRCAEAKLRHQLQELRFRCSVVWWKKFLPKEIPECKLPQDFQEIRRLRYFFVVLACH